MLKDKLRPRLWLLFEKLFQRRFQGAIYCVDLMLDGEKAVLLGFCICFGNMPRRGGSLQLVVRPYDSDAATLFYSICSY